jgi:hypothetical protein
MAARMVPSKPPSVIKENAAREHVGRVLPAGAPIPTEHTARGGDCWVGIGACASRYSANWLAGRLQP